ncbi:hypothetical protein BKA70DRAFT_1448283 [Coprinopsis sp. MPI-PUGE-AT-0042]|nr:hypothetical protein BKA70DRAFT_1448283 [Coprinopsis sp. MPI-PUGE-AT-0042]
MSAPTNLTGSMDVFTYAGAPSPNHLYTPPDSTSIPPTFTSDLNAAELSVTDLYPAAPTMSDALRPLPLLTASHPTGSDTKATQVAAAALSDDEDEDEDFKAPALHSNEARREICKKCIGLEQHHHDEPHDGYTRFKENIPRPQKPSKVLNVSTVNHI